MQNTHKRSTILMVDDDEILLEFYEDVLSPEFEVLTATHTSEALRLLNDRPMDAVVCDLHLGSSSALGLLSWIQAKHPDLLCHTMILSGDPAPGPGGFDVRVAGKPIDADLLSQIVTELAGSARGAST